ncbi:hypothetical protein GCM10007874_53900 [Labrys miyagiensis]|uniref:Uncharacterized protein n=1 Tax=Labrys miyagiensis TaxID=346912 RepID=A0ABQ6CS01_9HYPH|nr:hypothetical protein [Labrys miyagiensis]GLS22372.1 hypothetical protein GCM10007874_53900 [Labrys miyagiensis]
MDEPACPTSCPDGGPANLPSRSLRTSLRANRFAESVFTAPAGRRGWFVAKVLVILTLAAAYYFAVAPLAAVYVANVGMPFLLAKFLVSAAGLFLVTEAWPRSVDSAQLHPCNFASA